MPIVIPERIISLFLKALATVGTNGADNMNASDVIRVVSVSILKIFERIICIVNEPNITNVIKPARYKEWVVNMLKSAIEPTTIQNMNIKYIPV